MFQRISFILPLLLVLLAGCMGKTAQQDPPVKPDPAPTACADAPTQAKRQPGKVAVFFTCNTDPVPSSPRLVLRDAPTEETALKTALEALLKGPTEAEQARGFRSFFSSETAGMLKGVTIVPEGRAVVNFADFRSKMNNASTSAGSAQLLQELGKTIFQFDQIKEAEIQIEGSCDAFFNWLQYGCEAMSASNYR